MPGDDWIRCGNRSSVDDGDTPPGVALTVPEAARVLRDAVKDKSYRAFPLGQEAGTTFGRSGSGSQSASYRDYESCLDKFARHFADLELSRLRAARSGQSASRSSSTSSGVEKSGRTYNKNLSILRDFFRFHVLRTRLHGDPTLPIERAKNRGVRRSTFSVDDRNAILASNPDLREQDRAPTAP